ncbi:MAG: M20 family metallopeptidase [Planctomycetota bacterium]
MNSLEYLQELIPYPSVSSESNSDITDCVESWLLKLHFEIERINYSDDRGVRKSCLVARKGPVVNGGLAWFGHTDVVPVESWSFPKSGPWTPLIADGRVYGRGACDMRGSLASMVAAAERMHYRTLSRPFYFIVTADEEVGMPGARKVVEQSQIYREIVKLETNAIIGEPTMLEVVHAHKGGRAVKATSIGRAAHSSTGLGVNANVALIPFLTEVGRIYAETETSAAWRDDRFQPPTPTLNIVIRDSNSALNITSAQSECIVYFRPMPGQNGDVLVERLRALAECHGLRFEVVFSGEPVFTDPATPFIQDLLKLTRQTMSRTVAYGTDGAIFTELRNMVIFGPGDIAQAHTDDEWISLEQLEKGAEVYHHCIEHWCCSASAAG